MIPAERALDVEALFAPHHVVAFAAAVQEQAIAELDDLERASTPAMAPARLAEFATARACARRALSELGLAAWPVARHRDRSPIWPDGVTGSITHTAGRCIAVVAHHGPRLAAIGLDLEQVARLRPELERRILHDRERSAFDDLDGVERRRALATVFAAKEAFYKAHHQLDSRYLGFGAITIVANDDGTLELGPGNGDVAESVLVRTRARTLSNGGTVTVGVAIEPAPGRFETGPDGGGYPDGP